MIRRTLSLLLATVLFAGISNAAQTPDLKVVKVVNEDKRTMFGSLAVKSMGELENKISAIPDKERTVIEFHQRGTSPRGNLTIERNLSEFAQRFGLAGIRKHGRRANRVEFEGPVKMNQALPIALEHKTSTSLLAIDSIVFKDSGGLKPVVSGIGRVHPDAQWILTMDVYAGGNFSHAYLPIRNETKTGMKLGSGTEPFTWEIPFELSEKRPSSSLPANWYSISIELVPTRFSHTEWIAERVIEMKSDKKTGDENETQLIGNASVTFEFKGRTRVMKADRISVVRSGVVTRLIGDGNVYME